MRRVRLAEKKVDNVKESIDAIGVVLTNRDERDGDAACDAYGVLNIEILYHEAYQKRAHEEQ